MPAKRAMEFHSSIFSDFSPSVRSKKEGERDGRRRRFRRCLHPGQSPSPSAVCSVPHKRLCSERSKSPLTNIPPSGGKGKTISPHSTLQVSETRFLKPKEFSFTVSFHRLQLLVRSMYISEAMCAHKKRGTRVLGWPQPPKSSRVKTGSALVRTVLHGAGEKRL